jgi:hypothetical protein
MDIVVASCGAYADAWKPFVRLFRKFWPDCPYKLFLITDKLAEPWEGDKAIVIGDDLGWGDNLVAGLRQMNGVRNVLLLQEDFFLSAPVNTDFLKRAEEEMMQNPACACFRLYPCPGADVPLTDWYGLIKHDAPYRVSCQAAIWYRPELEVMALHQPTAADFEIDGTRRAVKRCQCVKFFSVLRNDPKDWPFQYYCSAITRGQWTPDAVDFVKAQGIEIDTSKRPIMHCPR